MNTRTREVRLMDTWGCYFNESKEERLLNGGNVPFEGRDRFLTAKQCKTLHSAYQWRQAASQVGAAESDNMLDFGAETDSFNSAFSRVNEAARRSSEQVGQLIDELDRQL